MQEKLRFKNGVFKILHFTDVQESGRVHPAALALMEAALDAEKPDLVVFTGDQIAGYSLRHKGRKGKENISATIRQILAPLEARKIPFTFTFGNHDITHVLSRAAQFKIYKSSPLCVTENAPGIPGVGNCFLPIYDAAGTRIRFGVYCLDSHGNAGIGGYEAVTPAQVQWYKDTRDAMAARCGASVPALLFQHIPVPNIYDVLEKIPKDKTAVRGFRQRGSTYYQLPKDRVGIEERAVFVETPCVPDTDTGLFAAAQEKHDILGMYFGHDHKNAFSGTLDGIRLGYSPGVCFKSYGPGLRRGCRAITLNENDLTTFETRVYSTRELLGKDFLLPFSAKLWDLTPTSADDFKRRLLPPLLAVLGLFVASFLLGLFL